MAISRIQSVGNNAVDVTSLTATWDFTPVQNRLLIVMAAANQTAGDVTFTGPSGYTLATAAVSTSTKVTAATWYKIAGASEGNPQVQISAARDMAMIGLEYSGNVTASVIDKQANNSGLGTTSDTGTTATTAQAEELWMGMIAQQTSATQTSPTNGFSIVGNEVSNNAGGFSRCRVVALEKIVSATGTANTGCTVSASREWVGKMTTYKAAPVTEFSGWGIPIS